MSWRRLRLPLLIGTAIVVAVAGTIAAFVAVRLHQGRDVLGSSSVEFSTGETASRPRIPGVVWPTFGYDDRHTRVGPGRLRPPYRTIWTYGARALVEFPPVIGFGRLYFANNSGTLIAINTRTGKRAWKRYSQRCQAASPALTEDMVIVTYLNRRPCNASGSNLDGLVEAFSVGVGGLRWRTRIGPSESSPVVRGQRVYVGDWNGYVYALDVSSGRILWRFKTGGAVKAAVALDGNRLYVGSYDHHLYSLDARTGRLIWRASSQLRLGSQGAFYSTPAVSYGRVYIGSTDGKLYSFGASSGKLRWSQSTGGYVYSSPAVWRERVYVGSYSGDFVCFDAASGRELWRFRANGPISGSPTVLDGVVYFASFKRRTYALDARSGRLLWSFPDGQYNPVVSDGKRLYLVGLARIYGMVER
jgi:outer membrane protein assembly factor BamB